MKENNKIIFITIISITMVVLIYLMFFQNNQITCIEAIEKVYSEEIEGMSVVVFKDVNFEGSTSTGEIYDAATGSVENDFSLSSFAGVKLWSVKQLLLGLKDLKVVNEESIEIAILESKFYLIMVNQDYLKSNKNDIHQLYFWMDSETYNVFVPKHYISYDKFLIGNYECIEYEGNQVTKNLLNDIIFKNK